MFDTIFLLTRPLRDVTLVGSITSGKTLFLLTRPLRDVTCPPDRWRPRIRISTHTPLAGRDHSDKYCIRSVSGFLLTRPLRDVTLLNRKYVLSRVFLLTRPLRDVTPMDHPNGMCTFISTHTPLAGRDGIPFFPLIYFSSFLLTRPLRDVTEATTYMSVRDGISTHTPLAGRDQIIRDPFIALRNFYSHAPCGT